MVKQHLRYSIGQSPAIPKGLAVSAVVFGAMRVALTLVMIAQLRSIYSQMPPEPRSFVVRRSIEALVLFSLSLSLMVLGTIALRGRNVRELFVAWACVSLGYSLYCVVFDAVQAASDIPPVTVYRVFVSSALALERWIWDFQFPVLLIAWLASYRHRKVTEETNEGEADNACEVSEGDANIQR